MLCLTLQTGRTFSAKVSLWLSVTTDHIMKDSLNTRGQKGNAEYTFKKVTEQQLNELCICSWEDIWQSEKYFTVTVCVSSRYVVHVRIVKSLLDKNLRSWFYFKHRAENGNKYKLVAFYFIFYPVLFSSKFRVYNCNHSTKVVLL